MQTLQRMLTNYTDVLHIPAVGWTDIVEILIIAVLVYYTILWVKNTSAYSLLNCGDRTDCHFAAGASYCNGGTWTEEYFCGSIPGRLQRWRRIVFGQDYF